MTPETPATGRSLRAGGWLATPPPDAALEIAGDRVTALALGGSLREPVIAAYAVEPLATGAVTPALNAANVHDAAALTAALQSALQKAGLRARRVALVLPDTIAKVSLIRFEKIPARAQDLDQLIRWQVRKAAPFRIEDAQISWISGLPLAGGGREYVVSVARRDLIESYERACDAAGVHAGLIDIATFCLINTHIAGTGTEAGDWLLVHVGNDYVTLALVRGEHLVFFRNRTLGAEGDLADLVHQTAMYHEDRLGGGGFSRVVLTGATIVGPEPSERLRRGIEERLGSRVELLDVRNAAAMRDRISASPALLDALGAPAGALLRERVTPRAAPGGAAGQVA
jgi:type IV pilus assembly protein PilM